MGTESGWECVCLNLELCMNVQIYTEYCDTISKLIFGNTILKFIRRNLLISNPNHLKSLFRSLAYSKVKLSQYNCRNEAIIVANTRYSHEGRPITRWQQRGHTVRHYSNSSHNRIAQSRVVRVRGNTGSDPVRNIWSERGRDDSGGQFEQPINGIISQFPDAFVWNRI